MMELHENLAFSWPMIIAIIFAIIVATKIVRDRAERKRLVPRAYLGETIYGREETSDRP